MDQLVGPQQCPLDSNKNNWNNVRDAAINHTTLKCNFVNSLNALQTATNQLGNA